VDRVRRGLPRRRHDPYGDATADRFTGALDARLHAPAPTVAGPRLYAYRTGDTGVAVRAHDDSLIVTATTPCQ